MTDVWFRPGKLLTIVVGLAFIVLIFLGTWQARKIGPKTALVSSITSGLMAEPMQLPVHVDDPQSVAYRRISFHGEVMNSEPVRVFGTNLKGRPGYYLYKPVVREFGRAVLVNFGWVPLELKKEPSLPSGMTTISGVLLLSAEPGSFTPPNDLANNIWYTADVFEMASHFGLGAKDHYHFRIFADAAEDVEYPLGGQVRIDIPNDHFEYMLTWYGIAAALLGVYVAFGRKKAQESS